ncbi:MAG: hypothetical protein ACRC1K_08440, partial [Planctomycetia bacterium]
MAERNGTTPTLGAALAAAAVGLPAAWPIVAAAADPATWSDALGDASRAATLAAVTGLLALGTAALAAPLGFLVAVALVRLPNLRWFALALATAAVVPLPLYVGGWLAVVGPGGPAAPFVEPSWVLRGWLPVLVVHATAALPWTAALYALALSTTDPAAEEQALLDVDPWSAFAVAVGPRMRATTPLAVLVAVVPVLTDMTATDLFVVRSAAEEVLKQFETGGSARSATLLTLPFFAATVFLVGRGLSRFVGSAELPAAPRSLPLDAWGIAVLAAAAVATALAVLPLVGLGWQLGLSTDAANPA